MQMKRPYPVYVLIVMLILFSSLACAPKKVPPAEAPKGKIVIGILDGFSGPVGGVCTATRGGAELYVRYKNEKEGGILGHPLESIAVDTKMDSAVAMAGWDRMKNENALAVLSIITAAASPIVDQSAQNDHIPVIAGAGSMNQLYPTEASFWFCSAPQIVSVFDSISDMIESDWQKKGKAGTPKVGIDMVNIGLAPRIWLKKFEMVMAERGWDYTVTRSSIAAVDMATSVLQMKKFGADYLILQCTEAANIAWFKDLDRQNFHPLIFGSTNLASQEMRSSVGDLIAGSTFYIFSPQWFDTDLPLVQLVHDLNAEWSPEVPWQPPHYIRGFADGMAIAGAIEKAIENVGYANIDGNASKEAMESLRDYDTLGYGIGYTWTPTDHQGIHGVRWYRWTEDGTTMEPAMKGWDVFEPLPQEQMTNDYWLGK